jgi:hypothetical protein
MTGFAKEPPNIFPRHAACSGSFADAFLSAMCLEHQIDYNLAMAERRTLDYETPNAPARSQAGCLPRFLVTAIVLAILYAWGNGYRGGYVRQVRYQIYFNATVSVLVASAVLLVIWWRTKRR